MFFSDSIRELGWYLHTSKLFEPLYDIAGDYNVVFDEDTGHTYSSDIVNDEELAILFLLILRSVRSKLMDENYRISEDDIHTAITEMIFIAKKLYDHSYRKYWGDKEVKYIGDKEVKKIKTTEEKLCYNEEAIDYVKTFFIVLFDEIDLLGKVSVPCTSHWWSDKDKIKIKETIHNIIHDPILLDHLPMDLLAIIDKEYYTRTHKEFMEEKAMVSWFDIIDSLTEDQLDDIGPIKLFIYEALGNKFPRWTSDAIKKKLTEKIKTLKTPTPSITLQADKVSFEDKVENVKITERK